MYITQTALFGIVGSLALLVAACIYLYVLYHRARHAKKQVLVGDPTNQVIERAHQRAQHIIDRAVEHSEETLYQTEFLKAELVRHGEESIQEVVNNILTQLNRDGVKYDADYKTLFDSIQKEYVTKTNDAISKLQSEAARELEGFHETIKAGTLGSQTTLDHKIEEEFTRAQQEIVTYRDAQYKKIDRQITKMVGQVVEEVIGQVIPLEAHEKLILEALQTAKQGTLFENHIVMPEEKAGEVEKSEIEAEKSETNTNVQK